MDVSSASLDNILVFDLKIHSLVLPPFSNSLLYFLLSSNIQGKKKLISNTNSASLKVSMVLCAQACLPLVQEPLDFGLYYLFGPK